MPKSIEQKTAEALDAGVRDVLWSPTMFARHILKLDLVVQWRILTTVIVLIKELRKESKQPHQNFSDYLDDEDVRETEEIVDLTRFDT